MWVLIFLIVTSFGIVVRPQNTTTLQRVQELAFLDDVDGAILQLSNATRSTLHLRCNALLRIVKNEPHAALSSLTQARYLSPSDGVSGGCPDLQDIFFSSAVVLMRLRNLQSDNPTNSYAAITCDEHISIATELEQMGLLTYASSHLTSALTGTGCMQSVSSILVHDALLCPSYFNSASEIARWRERITNKVKNVLYRCEKELMNIDQLSSFSLPGTFDIVYMGYSSDVTLMRSIASMYSCVYPLFHQVQLPVPITQALSVHTNERKPKGVRVGFLSAHFRRHSVCKLWCGLISELATKVDVDVFIILASDAQDQWTLNVTNNANVLRVANGDEKGSRDILNLKLDVLVYLDIGMHQFTYAWGFARLAPVQMVTWGHPVTTGLPSIDFFISSKLFTSYRAEELERFSEQLVMFDSLSFFFPWPIGWEVAMHESLLVLPQLGEINGPIVACPQALMKLHPDFDQAIVKIMQRHPTAHIVFVCDDTQPRQLAWKKKLLSRFFSSSNGSLNASIFEKRVVFLRRLSPLEFMALMRQATIVLDVFPFGGGVTTLEAFAVCAPVITAPSLQTVPQLASGMYKQLGISTQEVVAWEGVEDYVNKSIELLYNKEKRDLLVSSICDNRHKLFNQQSTVEEWQSFLQKTL